MFLFYSILFITLFILNINTAVYSKTKINSEILYLSPVPGSDYITPETNIIIRFKNPINIKSIAAGNFAIEGTQSGKHSFRIIHENDNYTIILKPDHYFSRGEVVTVSIRKGITAIKGSEIQSYKFNFNITNTIIDKSINYGLFYLEKDLKNNDYVHQDNAYNSIGPPFRSDSIPPDFPLITVTKKKYDTAPGHIFLSNFGFGPSAGPPYLMVLNNSGYPILYKKMSGSCFDFKVQNNNTFSYYDGVTAKFYCTNTSFSIIDSFYCGNGYKTDGHELLLLPNNHAYLMSYDPQIVNMSQIVQGGDTAALVTGLIIQELDENKNVIFQWRSWDHFRITDATHENLLDDTIDYVHGNAIDLDHDGHILISSRHLDEITKINRQTGNIIWRLGGKNNQFNFVNDSIRFSHQHSIRKMENGNYLLFDNGNYHSPPFSRAVEYKLDNIQNTATLVWQYRNSPNTFAFAMGNIHRLENGNTIIGWGSATPTVSEVRPDGLKVFQLSFAFGIFSYRAFRYVWEETPVVLPALYNLYQNYPNPFNSTTSIKYDLPENGNVSLKIYDILGREVRTLISEYKQAGSYLIDFHSENFASGVYFYKLTANYFSSTRRMVLVK
jgi:hypothetical protein